MLRWLFLLLVGAILFAAFTRLVAALGLRRQVGQTVHRLSPSGGMFWTVIFLALGMAVVLYAASFLRDVSRIAEITVCLVYGAIAAGLGLVVFCYQVFWTLDGIGSWDPWRKRRFMRWDDVVEVARWPSLTLVRIKDRRMAISYSTWFDGAAELQAFLTRRSPPIGTA